jgi:hypothetical protein
MYKSCLWLILILLMFAGVKAQTLPGVLEYYSTSRGGGVHRLVVKGDFLFAGEGSSLVVYDMRTPTYQRVFERRFCSPVTDMCLHNGFLYVTANHDGLTKWDISIPIKPALAGEFRPQDSFTGFQTLRFSHDTLFTAANSAVWMLRETAGLNAGFEKIGQIAEQLEGRGRTVCGEVMGPHYIAAITGREKGIGQGIHAFLVSPETRLNFHHYDAGEPEELMRWPGTDQVIAFGGEGRADAAHMMGIDCSDPAHPALAWVDTVRGRGAAVRSGWLHGDTLWVPVNGLMTGGCAAASTGIAVYGLGKGGRPRLIGEIPLPAAPRHVARSGSRLHVALGDAGIVTYDLRKWSPGACDLLPEVGRSPKSGGYCRGADAVGDKLLTANGEAGVILHLIQDRKTIAMRSFEHLGNVKQVRLLADPDASGRSGAHAVCWVADREDTITLKVMQVGDPNDLGHGGQVVGSLEGPFGHTWVRAFQSRMVCARDDSTGFDILDFKNPSKPKKEQTVLLNFNDLYLDGLGRLIVSTEHNIRVFDLSQGGFTELATMAKWGEGYGAVASDGEAFYAYSQKRGIIRYRLVKDPDGSGRGSKGYGLKEELVWKTPEKAPDRMAVDEHGIYLAYNDHGIYALDKQTFENQGYYRTGLDFKGRELEGLRDLFCRGGKVFVVEWFGQVTVLKRVGVE